MINIRNLDKIYNKGKSTELHVINNTSLNLPSKGLVSLLGPSGSGKTTLLNVIGGLDKARGVIEYDDLIIKNYKMKAIDSYRKDNIGYIFQNYNLLTNETVYDNLAIALEMIGITDKDEIDRRIEYTLKSVGMFKYRKKLAYALSGGQQQRVAIARALIKNAKIIIADEPTGNLDSENTIEVMNILKKISATTLVILVTHDMNIARFYSDYIIELLDGRVIKQYKNEDDSTLARDNVNRVYLKDMHENKIDCDFGSVKLYSNDSNPINDLHFEIIVRNGNYFIQANKPLKLVENSNLKIINDHYKDLNVGALDEVEYDTSWFVKKKRNFKDKIKNLLFQVKKSYLDFRKVNKRGKFLQYAFGVMGLLVGASIICMINFATPDSSSFIYADKYDFITSEDHMFEQNPIVNINENYMNHSIDNIALYQPNTALLMERVVSFHKKINIRLNLMVLPYYSETDLKLIAGDYPKNSNEIVIDKITAADICKSYGNRSTYNDILNEKGKLMYSHQFENIKIVGVCDNGQRVAYGNEYFYSNWITKDEKNTFGNIRYFEYEVDENGEPLYEIIEGVDLTRMNSLGDRQVLIQENSEYVNYDTIELLGLEYQVVGYFRYKEGNFDVQLDEVITNYNFSREMYQFKPADPAKIRIIEGKMPVGNDECIVSVYNNKYKIGDTCSNKKVVGIYNGTVNMLSLSGIIDNESYILNNFEYDEICFNTIEKENLVLNDLETVISIFDFQSKHAKENQASNLKIFEILSIVLIFISCIFIYLVMRSKMFSEIYSIGVYRSLGASRKKIILKFSLDLVILVTFTAVVGYLIILVLYNLTAEGINNLLGEKMFRLNNLYFILGLICVYIINLVIGILPIITLLRKTPSEICSKYDI